MTKALVFALLTAACGSSGSGDPTHWKDQPIEEQAGTVSGHAYAIKLPKGMVKRASDTTDEYQYKAKRGGELYVFAPRIAVQWHDKKDTVDDAMKFVKTTPLKKESTDAGYVLVYPNDPPKKDKEDYLIEIARVVGDGEFTCSARLYEMKRGESVKDLIPKVEEMCNSITAK
jgi:hypothetical protein